MSSELDGNDVADASAGVADELVVIAEWFRSGADDPRFDRFVLSPSVLQGRTVITITRAEAGVLEATDVRLADLAAHMRRARLALATDSGGRHVAVAAGTPTVVVMGPNHPGYSEAPVGRYAVLIAKPPCWPCHLRRCPIDHRCMTAVTVEEVLSLARTYLRGEEPYGGARPWTAVPGSEHPHFSGAAC